MRHDRVYLADCTQSQITSRPLVHKIKNVLRKRRGDELILFDGRGSEFKAVIKEMEQASIELAPPQILRRAKKVLPQISLAFSLLKSSKVDFVFSKATELGIDRFIPFVSRHSMAGPPGTSKLSHWRTILIQACAQSGRLFLPSIESVVDFKALPDQCSGYDRVLVAQPSSSFELEAQLTGFSQKRENKILLVVGPEGGFSQKELESLVHIKNARIIGISNFILRAETASVFLAGLAAYYLDKREV